MRTYYEILEIAENAKCGEIEQAYHSICKKVKNLYEFSDETPNKILSKIEEAYMVLSDGKIRKSYDEWLFYKKAGGEDNFMDFAGLKVRKPKFNNSKDNLKNNIGGSLLKHCFVGAIYLAFQVAEMYLDDYLK